MLSAIFRTDQISICNSTLFPIFSLIIGLHLDESILKKVKDLNSKENNLCVDFSKNLNDVTTTLEFSAEELDGLSTDFLESLKKSVSFGFSHIFRLALSKN